MSYKKSRLFGVSNKKYLSELLQIDLYKLKNIEKYYQTNFYILDEGTKQRLIYPPEFNYKKRLRLINKYLSVLTLPKYVMGSVRNRSYITNGFEHKKSSFFLLMDIKDFYPSTSDYYVYGLFKNKFNMATDIAKILTLFTTEPRPSNPDIRHLPAGYPTSPILSILSYIDMFCELYNYANSQGIVFTCYVDDLTFSSKSFITKSFKRHIVKIIRSYGLEVNHAKTRHGNFEKGINITGTIIKDKSLYAPNKLQGKMIHTYDELVNLLKKDPNNLSDLKLLCNKLQGYVTAVKLIEDRRSLDYMENKIRKVGKHIKAR